MVGRERELELLLDRLAATRQVTLVGPGGVGKTRLALEAAHRLAGQGRAAFWADLTAVAPDRLVDLLAEVTGTVMARGEDPGGVLGASLHGSSAVLCLDNAESVLAELAPVVEALADAAPRLLILATSRERLGVVGEHVHQLAPLPLPSGPDRDNPAIRLFLERAHGAGRRTRRAATSRPSPSCAAGSTGCPWRSSWVRRGRPRSASGTSPRRSPPSSTCSRAGGAPPRPGTARSGRSSTPRTSCWRPRRRCCSSGSPSSPDRSGWRR